MVEDISSFKSRNVKDVTLGCPGIFSYNGRPACAQTPNVLTPFYCSGNLYTINDSDITSSLCLSNYFKVYVQGFKHHNWVVQWTKGLGTPGESFESEVIRMGSMVLYHFKTVKH